MKPITVLLVEDHAIVREVFYIMFEGKDDFDVVGAAQDGRQAVALATPNIPMQFAIVPRELLRHALQGSEGSESG